MRKGIPWSVPVDGLETLSATSINFKTVQCWVKTSKQQGYFFLWLVMTCDAVMSQSPTHPYANLEISKTGLVAVGSFMTFEAVAIFSVAVALQIPKRSPVWCWTQRTGIAHVDFFRIRQVSPGYIRWFAGFPCPQTNGFAVRSNTIWIEKSQRTICQKVAFSMISKRLPIMRLRKCGAGMHQRRHVFDLWRL